MKLEHPHILRLCNDHNKLSHIWVHTLIATMQYIFRKDSEQTKQIEELQKQHEDMREEKERLLEEIERILSEPDKM